MTENKGHRRQGEHVVDHGRLAKQAFKRRQRRFETYHAPLAFEALEQRGLLATNIGSGAKPYFKIETLATPQDIAAEITRRLGAGDGFIEDLVGQRVLRA